MLQMAYYFKRDAQRRVLIDLGARALGLLEDSASRDVAATLGVTRSRLYRAIRLARAAGHCGAWELPPELPEKPIDPILL